MKKIKSLLILAPACAISLALCSQISFAQDDPNSNQNYSSPDNNSNGPDRGPGPMENQNYSGPNNPDDQNMNNQNYSNGPEREQSSKSSSASTRSTTIVIKGHHHGGNGPFYVCYRPASRHITKTRVVHRCNPYNGCHNVHVTRTFHLHVYENCHIQKHSCTHGYLRFGKYSHRGEAHHAVERCASFHHGQMPREWHHSY